MDAGAIKQIIEYGKAVNAYMTRPQLEEAFKILKDLTKTIGLGADEGVIASVVSAIPVECTLPRLVIHQKCEVTRATCSLVAETLSHAVPLHLLVGLDFLCDVVAKFTKFILQSVSIKCREAANVLQLLLKKMKECDFDKQCLTPLHTHLLSLYLNLGDCQNALAVARLKFTTAHNPVKYSGSVLLFFYYSSIAFCWNKEYESAEKCLELVCFSPPLTVPSWIVICAYRKLILVSLIVHGRVSASVRERVRPFLDVRGVYEQTNIGSYEELVDAYQNLKIRLFQKARTQKQALLSRDGNLGLAKVAEIQLMRHLVVKMQSIYTVCTLDQMLKYASVSEPMPADYEKLRNAVDSLQASGMGVSFKDTERTIVQFKDEWSPSTFTTPESVKNLEDRVRVVLASCHSLEEKRESALIHNSFQSAAAIEPRGFEFEEDNAIDDDVDDDDDDFDNAKF